MKPRFLVLLAGFLLALSCRAALTDSPDQDQRIQASFMLTFGRAASASEIESARQLGGLSAARLREQFQQRLQGDEASRREVAVRACEDALGRAPTQAELGQSGEGGEAYAQQVRRHLDRLAANAGEYRQVLDRAYQFVIRRPAYDNEVSYWTKVGTVPYFLVVGCVEGWARRNAPGLMETEGTPAIAAYSRFLTTARLSAATTAEVRAAFGLMPAEALERAESFAHNVVAPGAGGIFTEGNVHLVAVGIASLVEHR